MNRHTPDPTNPQHDQFTGPRPALLTLVMFAAVSPLAINMFVPSMPDIARDLDAPYATIQLGLSLYLIMTAGLQLAIGPLSDLYGRRPIIYTGLALFIVGTVICIFAQSATWFLAGRMIQSGSAAGMVLSRAIVRDIYPREKAASAMGYMVMGMAIAPMLGPAIGGIIAELTNWRMTFVVLGLFAVAAVILGLFNLPETNRFRGAPVRQQIDSYKSLTRLPLFWLYAGVSGFASAGFFSFVGGGPAVAAVYLDLSPSIYGLYFIFTAFGYSVGNFLTGRYSERRGLERMMLEGVLITFAGPLITILLFSMGIEHPLALFMPMALVGFGNGFTLPNAATAAISLKPDAAGAASGLLGATQIGIGAVASIIAGIVVGKEGLPIPLSAFIAVTSFVAIIFTMIALRKTRRTP